MIPHATRARLLRAATAAALVGALSGCAALSTLSSASEPLATYALTPLPGAAGPVAGGRHVVVEVPTGSGAIAGERFVVRPDRLQVTVLPGARWVDPAPVMVQTLLVQSLQASGAFRLVGRSSTGLFPDVTLLTEMRAFQAEPGPEGGPVYRVRVGFTMTLIREADGAILRARTFEATAAAGSAAPSAVAAAFEAAMTAVLREAVPWVAGASGA